MKQFFLIVFLLLSCVQVQAQFTVTAEGKLYSRESEGEPILTARKAYLESDSTSLYIANQNSIKSSYVSYGLCSDNIMSKDSIDGGFHFGVCGHVFSEDHKRNNTGKAYGVWGAAGNATEGFNYGVFGKIEPSPFRTPSFPHFSNRKIGGGQLVSASKGAAIYGTVYESDYGDCLDDSYAGYFNGKVSINGNLTISGNINGVILGASTESFSGDIVEESLFNVENKGLRITDKLANVSAASYYIPSEISSKEIARVITSDSTEVTREMNPIELQNLSKRHYALYAEQLEEMFPDLVYENEDGTKSINYIEMIPLLVQSVNELSNEVKELKGENAAYKSKYATGIDNLEEMKLSMGQNTPNPWNVKTSIPLNIPESVKDAHLYLYDLSGKQMKDYSISQRGAYSFELSPDGLQAGMYIYTLIADNSVVATRRMILTK